MESQECLHICFLVPPPPPTPPPQRNPWHSKQPTHSSVGHQTRARFVYSSDSGVASTTLINWVISLHWPPVNHPTGGSSSTPISSSKLVETFVYKILTDRRPMRFTRPRQICFLPPPREAPPNPPRYYITTASRL